MKFEKSFTKEMAEKIGSDAIYYNYYEDLSINYKLYSYIRFFNSGQFAIFNSQIKEVDINNLQKAFIVGYYNILNGKLLLEIPNTSFSKAGKSLIREFEIEGNILKEKRKSIETEKIYIKVKIMELKPIYPDW